MMPTVGSIFASCVRDDEERGRRLGLLFDAQSCAPRAYPFYHEWPRQIGWRDGAPLRSSNQPAARPPGSRLATPMLFCCPHERHLLEAVRYVLLNPVRARLRKSAALWPWSSFHAHGRGADDLVDTAPLALRMSSVEAFVAVGLGRDVAEQIRSSTRSGRPLGDARFVGDIALAQGIILTSRKRGRPASIADGAAGETPARSARSD
jgi:hypothetical protein